MPFDGNDIQGLFGAIKRGQFVMPQELSEECKSVLQGMLTLDQSKRMSA